ncbi:MAG TPA: hypothetical protein VMN37_06030 [Gemmatimonadales bacterium]|nr:hypothetical protein [Gemmatimonadales bacterium]
MFALVLGAGERHGGAGWELASLIVTVGYPRALLVGMAHAVRARADHGRRAVFPLLLLLTALPGIGGLRAADGLLHDRRFAHHLPELEALLARAPIDSGRRMRLPADSLPRAVRDCCARLVLVRRDSVGQLSATFLGQRKTAYLYDPSGTRLVRGIGSRRWRSHERLAPDWYRVVRF